MKGNFKDSLVILRILNQRSSLHVVAVCASRGLRQKRYFESKLLFCYAMVLKLGGLEVYLRGCETKAPLSYFK